MDINSLNANQPTSILEIKANNNLATIKSYLSKVDEIDNKSLKQPGNTLQSLSALAIEKAVKNNTYHQIGNNNSWYMNAQLNACCLFSPELNQQTWNEQLIALQQKQANVCGISFANFEHVVVQDLAMLNPEEAEPFSQLPKNSLLVVFGACDRKVPLNIANNITVIGSNALINMGDTSWSLSIPESHLSPYNTENKATDLSEIIILNEANLIGVCIHSNNVAKAITANGNMDNPLVIKNNTITGKGSIIINKANCAIATNNIIPTNVALDDNGFTTEDSYTQGIHIASVNTYLGDCSDSISTNKDTASIEKIKELEASRRLYSKKNLNDSNVEFLENIFSPDANSDIWQENLLWLQKNLAEISGIKASNFNHVSLVNLDNIDPDDKDQFIKKGPENLIVVYGEAFRKSHLPISGGATIIGSEAVIKLQNSPVVYKLNIPEALISIYYNPITGGVYRYGDRIPDNAWGIGSSEDISTLDTNPAMLLAGDYPLVYIKSSNLIGVQIHGYRVAKAIVAYGEGTNSIVIADCTFGSPKGNNHHAFIHNCEEIRLERNDYYGGYGPLFHKCNNITFLNRTEYLDLSTWEPGQVELFARGTESN